MVFAKWVNCQIILANMISSFSSNLLKPEFPIIKRGDYSIKWDILISYVPNTELRNLVAKRIVVPEDIHVIFCKRTSQLIIRDCKASSFYFYFSIQKSFFRINDKTAFPWNCKSFDVVKLSGQYHWKMG